MMRIRGVRCVMGCGETLMLDPTHGIICSYLQCPSPTAVAAILADGETEHIIRVSNGALTIQHPLRERLEGGLFACSLDAHCMEHEPTADGHWRAWWDGEQWKFRRLTGGAP